MELCDADWKGGKEGGVSGEGGFRCIVKYIFEPVIVGMLDFSLRWNKVVQERGCEREGKEM